MRLWAPSQSVSWHDTGPPSWADEPRRGRCGKWSGNAGGVFGSTVSGKETGSQRKKWGEGLAMAMLAETLISACMAILRRKHH